MPDPVVLRRLIGRALDIDRRDGVHVHGVLVNVTRSSCWLIEGDEDTFVPLTAIAHWRAA